MKFSATIAPLSHASDYQRILFYRRMYSNTRSEFLSEHWRWHYRVGYIGGIEPLVAIRDDHIVGHAGVVPVNVGWGKETMPAIWYVDLAVLPEFQRQGLANNLTESIMAMGPEKKIYFTNPSKQSLPILTPFGWTKNRNMCCCAIPLKIGRLSKRYGALMQTAAAVLSLPYMAALKVGFNSAPHLVAERISDDAEEISRIFSETHSSLQMIRDAEWVRWRIFQNPFKENFRLMRFEDSYAIIRVFVCQNEKRVHILLLSSSGAMSSRMKLLKGIIQWAIAREADLVWFATNDEALLKATRSLLPWRSTLNFAALSFDTELQRTLLHGTLPLHQPIDNDYDLSFIPDSKTEA